MSVKDVMRQFEYRMHCCNRENEKNNLFVIYDEAALWLEFIGKAGNWL